ncbi:MAG: FAD-dependent oxidoreductase [Hyphomicrobiaceae bacterium]|nr:FAD-dependent oxidoreductase [Hyphomicrobiaceae bacterium]
MKSHARAVVIGGGVVGASVLYHLTRIGWTDVVLLEKHELTSGSSWHAAANVHTYNSDANVSRLQKYTIDLYREIERISGQSCGIHATGNLVLAADQTVMDNIRMMASRARYLGLEVEMLTPKQAKELNPLIDERCFIGALRRHDGGHVDPNGVTQAYVIAARTAGAEVHRFTRVLELHPRQDGSWRIVTDKGDIVAEHVVNAAGLWAREVGRMAGIELPVLAMEHMYIVTDEVPEVAAHSRELLPTTDYSGEIYLRQEGKGVLMGTYERDCRVWSPDTTPWDFAMELLPDDVERLSPHLAIGFEHFPPIGRAGIKRVVNGPFTFAPDGNPLVGPVRGLRNYWCACGVMAGFAQGGGVGLALSQWMANGDPGSDIFAMDVARFGAFATPRYTNTKVQENYKRRFRMAFPNEELPAARPLRRTPVYDRLKSAGAVFGASFALEVPLWYAPAGVEPVEAPSYGRSNAFPFVKAECLAIRNAVGLMEISGFGKYEIAGPDAEVWLDRMLAGRLPRVGRVALTPMLNERGRIIGDFSVARLAADRFLMIGSAVAEVYHMRWFEQHAPPLGTAIRPLSHALTGFMIAGPRSRELLARLVREDISNEAFRFFSVGEMAVGMVPATVIRASYTGDLGYEIWVTPDYQVTLYETLVKAGRDLGLAHAGSRALMSLRLEKAYGAFLREFRPDYTPMESGLSRFVAYDKPDFIGRTAALEDRASPPTRKLVPLIVDTDVEVVGYESIIKDGAAVGQVTSGGYAHWADRSMALGYVRAELARDGETFSIDIFGKERPAVIQTSPLFDPNGGRQRG